MFHMHLVHLIIKTQRDLKTFYNTEFHFHRHFSLKLCYAIKFIYILLRMTYMTLLDVNQNETCRTA